MAIMKYGTKIWGSKKNKTNPAFMANFPLRALATFRRGYLETKKMSRALVASLTGLGGHKLKFQILSLR